MTDSWSYQVEVRAEESEFHAYAPDLPEAIASGATEAEALREMGEALAAAVRGRIKDGMDLGVPSRAKGRKLRVSLPARLAAKASVYAAWKAADISKSGLARRMGRDEVEIRRILDPDHGTKLDQLEDAARALGGRLSIGFEAG